MDASTIAQVNVRMERSLKERGDDTLRLAGSTPARIIRQLWECLASGGDAYERVMAAILSEAYVHAIATMRVSASEGKERPCMHHAAASTAMLG